MSRLKIALWIISIFTYNDNYGQEVKTSNSTGIWQSKRSEKLRELEIHLVSLKSDSIKITALQQLKIASDPKEIDSLKKVIRKSKKLAKKALKDSEEYGELKGQADPYLEHYKQNKPLLDLTDSATQQVVYSKAKEYGKTELEQQEEVEKLKSELTPYVNSPYLEGVSLHDLDSLSADSLKSIAKNTYHKLEKAAEREIMTRAELQEFQARASELEALKKLPESYRKQFENFKNVEGWKEQALNEGAQRGRSLLSDLSPQINAIQSDLVKLKRKYSSLGSTDDQKSGTKRNSLKGTPLSRRWVIGTNFQIVSLEPVLIDFSPMIGYRLNKKVHVGAGGTYRARFSQIPANGSIKYGQDELTYGYRFFTEYRVWKTIRLHAEYERISKEFEVTNTDIFERKWVEGALAGLATSYSLKGTKVKGNFSVLYNFIYNNKQAVYTSPWVFRFGFDLGL